jgi:hypothetical protein
MAKLPFSFYFLNVTHLVILNIYKKKLQASLGAERSLMHFFSTTFFFLPPHLSPVPSSMVPEKMLIELLLTLRETWWGHPFIYILEIILVKVHT